MTPLLAATRFGLAWIYQTNSFPSRCPPPKGKKKVAVFVWTCVSFCPLPAHKHRHLTVSNSVGAATTPYQSSRVPAPYANGELISLIRTMLGRGEDGPTQGKYRTRGLDFPVAGVSQSH